MEQVSVWVVDMETVARQFFGAIAAYIPSLLGAILIVIAGWMLARLLRAGTLRLGDSANRLLARAGTTGLPSSFRLSPAPMRIVAGLVFWVIMLLFITAATRVAGLGAFSDWLDRIVVYVPRLVAGGVIVLAGYLISQVIRDLVATALASAKVSQGELIGLLVQWAVLLAAIIIGVEQLGVDVTFLIIIAAMVIGGFAAAIAIAFGVGARDLVANLIAAHHARRQLLLGQDVSVEGIRGELLEVTATGLVLATAEGRAFVPASTYLTAVVTVATSDDGGDDNG